MKGNGKVTSLEEPLLFAPVGASEAVGVLWMVTGLVYRAQSSRTITRGGDSLQAQILALSVKRGCCA